MTHVPQLVAERWHRKQRVVADWSVPQFGQRHVDIGSQSTPSGRRRLRPKDRCRPAP